MIQKSLLPEPEDVQAHLIGGVPEAEVQAKEKDFSRFGIGSALLFQAERPGYLSFVPGIDAKPAIKTILFVNWWQQIRYDLKTIIATGWHHGLIPDDSLVAACFRAEADAIETLEAEIGEAQSELAEAVETAQEVVAYEPDEDEKVTAAVIKKALKDLIGDLKGSGGDSARKELKILQDQDKAIKAIESRIKDAKADLKTKTDERPSNSSSNAWAARSSRRKAGTSSGRWKPDWPNWPNWIHRTKMKRKKAPP
jgi:hypothetical protein